MRFLLEYEKYDPRSEYFSDRRRSINLESVRKSAEYQRLIDLGFKEDTSHQQELNNTLKFVRSSLIQNERGHRKVFYTIHPTGKVRRYNPVIDRDNPKEMLEGNGNIIRDFGKPFKNSDEYIKGLKYLWQYIKRKEETGNYR